MYFVSFVSFTGHAGLIAPFHDEERARTVYVNAVAARDKCVEDKIHAPFEFEDESGTRHHLNLVNFRISFGSLDRLTKQESDYRKTIQELDVKYGAARPGFIGGNT